MEKITMDGHYQTRDGRAVRVLCVDTKGSVYPVVAAVSNARGDAEVINRYTADGRFEYEQYSPTPHDLIPAPKRHTKWLNLYGDSPDAFAHDSREAADRVVGARDRLACICVTFTEGEGLEQK